MTTIEPIATGRVESLSLNGTPVPRISFRLTGPAGDHHTGYFRALSGHDGEYRRTSELERGDRIFNTRTYTALSKEELAEIESSLDLAIPQGCLLENLVVSGIPSFSQLAPTSRLVFPKKADGSGQAILIAWEENEPCSGVGMRLEEHHGVKRLSSRFIAAAQRKRGVVGFVYSAGDVEVGDPIRVYPPVQYR